MTDTRKAEEHRVFLFSYLSPLPMVEPARKESQEQGYSLANLDMKMGTQTIFPDFLIFFAFAVKRTRRLI